MVCLHMFKICYMYVGRSLNIEERTFSDIELMDKEIDITWWLSVSHFKQSLDCVITNGRYITAKHRRENWSLWSLNKKWELKIYIKKKTKYFWYIIKQKTTHTGHMECNRWSDLSGEFMFISDREETKQRLVKCQIFLRTTSDRKSWREPWSPMP